MRTSFTPYDPEVNLGVFRTFCERYGIRISAEDSASLMEFFEAFECVWNVFRQQGTGNGSASAWQARAAG